ncbi:hypothetical protein D3C71_2037030 [compost metagenome]
MGAVAAEMQAVAGLHDHLFAVQALGDGAFEDEEDFLALMRYRFRTVSGRHGHEKAR